MTFKASKIGKRDRSALAADVADMTTQARKKTKPSKRPQQILSYNVQTQNRYGQLGNNISELTKIEPENKVKPPTPITVTEKGKPLDEILQATKIAYRKILLASVHEFTPTALTTKRQLKSSL